MAAAYVFNWDHWWRCERKLRYATEAAAECAAYNTNAPVPLHAYVCPFDGGHWHIGRVANPLGASR